MRNVFSRRNILFSLAALAVVGPSGVFKVGDQIGPTPLFDPKIFSGNPAIGLIFVGHDERVQRGVDLLKSGAIEKLIVLSTYSRKKVLDRFNAGDSKRNDVLFFDGALNTAEEARTAIRWLQNEKYRDVVIVTTEGHNRRCKTLLAPLGQSYNFWTVDPHETGRVERFKLGLTKLGVTRIPHLQIPYL